MSPHVLTRRLPVAVLASLAVNGCRPAVPVAVPAPSPRPPAALRCEPRRAQVDDTLQLVLSASLGGEMAIVNPDGVFYQLVNENPTPEMGPQLMTAAALREVREIRLAIATLQGLPYVYRAQAAEPVFHREGTYRIRISERLNTDDGTPVAECTVRFRGR